jgi:hypothetical protein
MKLGTKLGLIFGGIIFLFGLVILIAFVGFTLFGLSSATERSRAIYKKQTAETVGTITNVSLSSLGKIYTYKYVVNGVSYSATYTTSRSRIENDYERDVGRKGTVCYDPSDPHSSDFYYEKTTPCGGSQ